jgi:hypothetical protein
VPVTLIDYDYLINKKKIEAEDDFTACLNPVTEYRAKAVADANVQNLKKFDIIQFERKGFYIYQGTKDAEGRMEFGFIPEYVPCLRRPTLTDIAQRPNLHRRAEGSAIQGIHHGRRRRTR